MHKWARYEFSVHASLCRRDQQILVERTCARCGCENEWRVQADSVVERGDLTAVQVRSLAKGSSADRCWLVLRDHLLIAAADALHDHGTMSDELMRQLRSVLDERQLLDLILLCGWYHSVCLATNAAPISLKGVRARFGEVFCDAR